MREITPRGISGDDLVHQLNIALETREKIFEAANDGVDIHLDLSSAEWFTSSFLVPISVVYNRVREKDVDISVSTPPNYQTRSYLDQICFPEGTPEPENTYTNQIPLCLMNTDLDEDVIEVVGDEISKILKKQFSDVKDSGGIDWIKIPITEMIDNVDYHSYCDYGAVLIQNYPNKEFLDVCIADDGISIPGSYDRFDVEYDDSIDALFKAATEGLTTRPDAGHVRGFGLRTTISMICEGLEGQIILSSRDAMLSKNRDKRLKESKMEQEWPGTLFAARVYPPDENFHYMDYIFPD